MTSRVYYWYVLVCPPSIHCRCFLSKLQLTQNDLHPCVVFLQEQKESTETTKFPAATLNPKIVTLIAPLVNAGTQTTAIPR